MVSHRGSKGAQRFSESGIIYTTKGEGKPRYRKPTAKGIYMYSDVSVERTFQGAWKVWGDIGFRQYFYVTQKEAVRRYREEVKKERGKKVW